MLSIRTKLTSSMMATGMTTVLLAGIVFMVFSVREHRRDSILDLTSVASVIGQNCQVALKFHVRQDAETMLSALNVRPSVVRACIYDAEGNVFATYPAELLGEEWPAASAHTGVTAIHTFADGVLQLANPIRMEAGTALIGLLYLEDDMSDIQAALRRDAAVVAIIVALALVIAYLVSSQLQRLISKPVFSLANTAKQISESNDYSVRAAKYSEDELGYLTDAFNDMLSQIEAGHAAIGESREQYRRLVDNLVGTFLYRHDTDGVFAYVSSSVTRVLGYDPDEFLTDYRAHLTDHPINQQAIERTGLSISGILQAPFELQAYHKDGTAHWLEVSEVPIRDDAGAVVSVEGIAHDITARKRVEFEVEQSEQRYRTLFESSGEGIAILEIASQRFRYANPTFCRLLGYDVSDVPALLVDDMYPSESVKWVHNCLRGLAEGKMAVAQDVPYLRKDGSKVYIDMRSSPMVINEIPCIAHFLMDATGRRASEQQKEELLRAERLSSLGLLAGGVAHDLNNILGPMLVLPRIIKDEIRSLAGENDETAHEIAESLDVIHGSATRAATIVRDLVVMGRRGQYTRARVDLNSIECVTMNCEHVAELKTMYPNVSFNKNITKDVLSVSVDRDHIARVACNMIRNAAEAITGHGSVTVETSRRVLAEPHVGYETIPQGAYAAIAIIDTGEGIQPEYLGRIFEPFFTRKAKSDRSGSGLGLAIAHGIVKDHGGFIDVLSKVGEGTRFDLYLPLLDKAVAIEDVQRSETIPHGSERILVVDDEPGQRFLATRSLRRCGYAVSDVTNGHEALALFAEAAQSGDGAPFDLLILDMIMEEGFDGLVTYRRILELYPHQRAIVASGHAEDDRASDVQALGADWLAKPYTMEELACCVRNRLDR